MYQLGYSGLLLGSTFDSSFISDDLTYAVTLGIYINQVAQSIVVEAGMTSSLNFSHTGTFLSPSFSAD